MESPSGLSLPIPSLREGLRRRLADLGLGAEVQAWIPQPGPACPLSGEAGEAPEPSPRVVVSGADTWVGTYLDEVQSHWESVLAAHARRLAVAQAVHGLSNALTPLLCAETVQTLTTEEQARVTWRSETLRHLARGAETPSACAAGPFLQNLRRALEHAGVELQLESPPDLASRPLAPGHHFLRDRLLEALLAAHQDRGASPPPVLRLGTAGESLTLSLVASPGVLFSRRGADRVRIERSAEQTLLTWTLPRPWLAWLGPPPPDPRGLEAAGLGLLVIPALAAWDAVMSDRPTDFADRPLGVALGGPRSGHGRLKRALLERDLGLARASHSAATWPPCQIPEVVDVAAWCRAQVEQ